MGIGMDVASRIAMGFGRRSRPASVRARNRRRSADIPEVVADDSDRCDRRGPTGRDPVHESNVRVDDVDAPTAAIRARAEQALLVACEGWRAWRRCTAPDGTRVAHPHPECLAAQYRYELILLENGIPR